jgi:hypothetical protein
MGPIPVTALTRFLEVLFAIETIAAFAVLVLSGIEDRETLFGGEEQNYS